MCLVEESAHLTSPFCFREMLQSSHKTHEIEPKNYDDYANTT